jgi:hypothetical protein
MIYVQIFIKVYFDMDPLLYLNINTIIFEIYNKNL